MKRCAYVIANFGGPRNLDEIQPFLKALLTDQDVIRTNLPRLFHRILFSRIAKKRAKKISGDYASIGGRSPIFADTEAIADRLRQRIDASILTFHRYLPATHHRFIDEMHQLNCDEIRVFPLFPQFTYATTGSIARWFGKHLPSVIVNKLRWIKSYPSHPGFIHAHKNSIRNFIVKHQLEEKETILLFSAHGVPKKFITSGDLYADECEVSFHSIMEGFPDLLGVLCYQSKFGPGEWIKPYTIDVCHEIERYRKGRTNVVFIPLSFTSDHIETLFEIEQEYMPVIREKGLNVYRVPALTLNPDWIEAIAVMMKENQLCNNQMLIRQT